MEPLIERIANNLKLDKKIVSDVINEIDLEDLIMGVSEAAKLWGKSPTSIKRYCDDQTVKCTKVGNDWILHRNQPKPQIVRKSKKK